MISVVCLGEVDLCLFVYTKNDMHVYKTKGIKQTIWRNVSDDGGAEYTMGW